VDVVDEATMCLAARGNLETCAEQVARAVAIGRRLSKMP
jgi:hypothetical protein